MSFNLFLLLLKLKSKLTSVHCSSGNIPMVSELIEFGLEISETLKDPVI